MYAASLADDGKADLIGFEFILINKLSILWVFTNFKFSRFKSRFLSLSFLSLDFLSLGFLSLVFLSHLFDSNGVKVLSTSEV